MIPAQEFDVRRQAPRWETIVWPRWLPAHARLPLVAQITGAVALTALIVGPWWASAPDTIPSSTDTAAPRAAAPPAAASAPASTVATSTPAVPAEIAPAPPAAPVAPARPAHLNLDVRHSFASMNVTVSVDGKPALQTKLEGSGKRFGVFGKRAERGYTKTIELTPGVHLVRIRLLSADDKFDQTRVERFDLGSASVASMRVSADKSGLTFVAERPPAPPPVITAAAPPIAAPAPVAAPVQANVAVAATASRQDIDALTDVLHSVRSMLIWIAGFVATTATAFLLEEWFKKRKQQLLALGRLSRRRQRHRRPYDATATQDVAAVQDHHPPPVSTETEQAS